MTLITGDPLREIATHIRDSIGDGGPGWTPKAQERTDGEATLTYRTDDGREFIVTVQELVSAPRRR